jgi:signal transduction histidine kinase
VAEAEAEATKASTEAASTVTTCKSIGEAAREREHLADAARTAAQRSAAEAVAAAEKHSTEATRLQHQLTAAQAGMEVRHTAN